MPEYPDDEKGRCRSCGFLSKHSVSGRSPGPRFYEIERHERGRANHVQIFCYPTDVATRVLHLPTDLVCFVSEYDLMDELRGLPVGSEPQRLQRAEVAVDVIAYDRHCQSWYPYTPGFSPREHYDELKMQQLETDRRAFEMRLFEVGQEAQKMSIQVAQDSRQVVSDLKAIAEKNDAFSRRVTTWIILLAALQVIGALVALPSVSWVQRLWHHLFG